MEFGNFGIGVLDTLGYFKPPNATRAKDLPQSDFCSQES